MVFFTLKRQKNRLHNLRPAFSYAPGQSTMENFQHKTSDKIKSLYPRDYMDDINSSNY